MPVNYKKKEESFDSVNEEIIREGSDILSSERYKKAAFIPHHKKYYVAHHSIRTAKYALKYSDWLNRHGIHVDSRDVIRASLLHDIGMTEDEVFESVSYRKAYSHPKEGARIAVEEFGANVVQQNAILRHMWPVCVIPPTHLAGWVVLAADKTSSHREFFSVLGNLPAFRHRRKQRGSSVKEDSPDTF